MKHAFKLRITNDSYSDVFVQKKPHVLFRILSGNLIIGVNQINILLGILLTFLKISAMFLNDQKKSVVISLCKINRYKTCYLDILAQFAGLLVRVTHKLAPWTSSICLNLMNTWIILSILSMQSFFRANQQFIDIML